MLFFRSGERVRDWCAARGATPGPCVSIDQLWSLAVQWYANRMDPDGRRPAPAEMRKIFADLGLVEDFWDPQSDRFRP